MEPQDVYKRQAIVSVGKYAKANRLHFEMIDSLSKILFKYPLQDSAGLNFATEWVGTPNMGLRRPNYVIIHHTATNNCSEALTEFTTMCLRDRHIEGLSYFTHLSSIAIYGGNDAQNYVAEKKALQMGADIIVCTPGRMIAHLNMGYVNMKGLQFLVLDEADRMLDMGFQDDINKIIAVLSAERQTLLFSATMPDKIRQLARRILKNPVEINIAISKPPEKIIQKAFVVYEQQKLPLIKMPVSYTHLDVYKRQVSNSDL